MSKPLPRSAHNALETLRHRVRLIETRDRTGRDVLPFGLQDIDQRLPGGGLAMGALHEVAGGGEGAMDGAAASIFAASIVARLPGTVIWCLRHRDLFAPALAQVGLPPGRVIYAEAGDDANVLASMEEALRHRGLAGVVGEVGRLSMTASRRLQLAAEKSGTVAVAIRRWRRMADAADLGQPTAAVTRWRVSSLPSSPLPTVGVGRPRWMLELLRCRAGEAFDLEIEAPDSTGRLGLPSQVVYRSHPSVAGQERTAA